jgi:AcrR family transcriptional regulator
VGATAGSLARTPSQHARRARIIDTATQLLEERDYDRIQIREVAEGAGVALATLYRYFPSKEQLYAHVLLAWSESFDPYLPARGGVPSTDQARLRSALRRVVRAYERHPNFYRLITVLDVVTDPVVAELYTAFATRFGGSLRDALREVSEADAEVIVTMTTALLGSLLRSWSLGKTPVTRVYAELDRAVDLVFREPAPGARETDASDHEPPR